MPLFRRALFTLLLAATAFPQTPNHDSAAPRPGPVWSQFRKSHPYHIQAVALSEPDPAGERTLIVSEPPPHVTLDSLRALSPLLSSPKVETQHIGFDGWVKDVTYRLPALSDRDLTTLVDRLHYHLFGTTYKAYTIPIDAPPAAPLSAINVRVPASALNAWLVRSRETFRPIFGGVPSTVSALLLRGRSGVFLSDSPGFVVWIVPRKADLRDYTREARQFAVDSDLVLGAIGGASHVAIVARERVEPVSVLPPLRAETIMLLASVDSASLSQSYERRNFFAGRTRLQRLDWAPIYLSDSLIDTEYGSLLNITDQLLKSWSNNGTVHYLGFEYPSPSKWAFPKPVIDMLGVSSLTFNWNTKGAGYTVNLAGAKILAMNRTGALPVSYIPEGAPERAAEARGRVRERRVSLVRRSQRSQPRARRAVRPALPDLPRLQRHRVQGSGELFAPRAAGHGQGSGAAVDRVRGRPACHHRRLSRGLEAEPPGGRPGSTGPARASKGPDRVPESHGRYHLPGPRDDRGQSARRLCRVRPGRWRKRKPGGPAAISRSSRSSSCFAN